MESREGLNLNSLRERKKIARRTFYGSHSIKGGLLLKKGTGQSKKTTTRKKAPKKAKITSLP